MQLYRVKIRAFLGEANEQTDCLVVAANHDQAKAIACSSVSRSPETSEVESERVKPSFYIISQKYHDAPTSAALLAKRNEKISAPAKNWQIEVTGRVRASSENYAVGQMSRALAESAKMRGEKSSEYASDMNLTVREIDAGSLPKSRMEENAIFSNLRMFQGGAARGR